MRPAFASDRRDPGAQSLLVRRWILAASAVVFVLGAIRPRHPADWLLENALTFLAVAILLASRRRFVFSNLSLALLATFLALHTYGAHYTYSETPLGNWIRDALGLARNPYDRFVHLAFGLLLTYPWRELVLRVWHVHGAGAYVIPALASMTSSAGYELVESWVARIVAPELGTAFLGTQGDPWDAQKDMGAALAGLLLCLVAVAAYRARTGREPWHGAETVARIG